LAWGGRDNVGATPKDVDRRQVRRVQPNPALWSAWTLVPLKLEAGRDPRWAGMERDRYQAQKPEGF
jgi:hypothetical protein